MAAKAKTREGSPSTGQAEGARTTDLPRVPGTGAPTAAHVAVQAAPPVNVRSFEVQPAKAPPASVVGLKPYRLGTCDKAPIFTWTSPVTGVRFVRRTGKTNEHGMYESEIPGQIVRMTDEALAQTLEQVSKHVVRTVAGRGLVLHMGHGAFRSQHGDEPLGKFLFIHDVPEGAPNFYMANPKPLYVAEGE